jgi:hypothetical protein
MTQFGSMASNKQIGSRLTRLPLVLLLAVSLLFSLVHCATCELAFANADGAVTVMSIDRIRRPTRPSTSCPVIIAFLTSRLSKQMHLQSSLI